MSRCVYRGCFNDAADGRRQCEKHLLAGSEAQVRLRACRKAAGMCLRCGDPHPLPGRTMCQACNDAYNARGRTRARQRRVLKENHRNFRESRQLSGLCSVPDGKGGICNGSVIHGTYRCRRHNDREKNKVEVNTRAKRALLARRIAGGLCTQCGWEMPNDRQGMFLCTDCTVLRVESALAKRVERRVEGLCRCGVKPRNPERDLCARCRRKEKYRARRRYRDRKKKGVCRCCANPVWRTGSPFCQDHRVQALETEHRRDRRISRGAGAHPRPITEV